MSLFLGIDTSNYTTSAALLDTDARTVVQAKKLLPSRLQALASARGLQFRKVNIRKSHTRWGSCSSKGNISLSLYLMLLPPHLQDYVMQHELTHLIEMNHSSRYWALLDEVTAGNALQCRKEISNCHLPVL